MYKALYFGYFDKLLGRRNRGKDPVPLFFIIGARLGLLAWSFTRGAIFRQLNKYPFDCFHVFKFEQFSIFYQLPLL